MFKEKQVKGKEVPCIGEQHFYDDSNLQHIKDPALKEQIIESDFEAKPVNQTKIANNDALGGAKTRFLLSGLSVDETRLSALILCLLATMIFGGFAYFFTGDLTANLTSIITTLIYAIAGVNITNNVLNRFTNNQSINPSTQQNRKQIPDRNI